MWMLRALALMCINSAITVGLVALALMLLRPALRRLPAVVRPWLWVPVWWSAIYPGFSGIPCRWSFQNLFVPRTQTWNSKPEYFPHELQDGGTLRNIMLPGGFSLYSGDAASWYRFTDRFFFWVSIIWVVGAVAVCCFLLYQHMRLEAMIEPAQLLDVDFCRSAVGDHDNWRDQKYYLCPGLPTSFVRSHGAGYQIFLQSELTDTQRLEVLRHEYNHIVLHHCYWKGAFCACCVVCWFHPLVWLDYRFFCKDLELACDAHTLEKMPVAQRSNYAQTLLDCASAKPTFGSPTSFGETDAATRVRAAIAFRPAGWQKKLIAGMVALLLCAFFTLGPAATLGSATAEDNQSLYLRCVESYQEFSAFETWLPEEKSVTGIVSARYSEPADYEQPTLTFWVTIERQNGLDDCYEFYCWGNEWQMESVLNTGHFPRAGLVWHDIPIAPIYQ